MATNLPKRLIDKAEYNDTQLAEALYAECFTAPESNAKHILREAIRYVREQERRARPIPL